MAIEKLADGRRSLRAEVSWVDRFGNVQLAATTSVAGSGELPVTGRLDLTIGTALRTTVRRVGAFAELAPGELGLLVDGNGHWAIVAGEASAAHALDVEVGEIVVLTW